jgi:hypothetical protein
MSIPKWEEIGIPEGYGPHRLLYNQPSETLIVELKSVRGEFKPNRIYIRHKDAHKYRPIRTYEPMEGSESAVTSSRHPKLFYLSQIVEKRENYYAADWNGLYSLDILSGEEAKIVGKDSLLVPPPYNSGWVSSLVSSSEDAAELLIVVAMEAERTYSGFQAVDYRLASLDLATKKLGLISQLKGTFF